MERIRFMKKVTIMIPTYNQAVYIGQCVRSALSQDYPNLEVIIADDCSTDDTYDAVTPFLKDSRLKYFRNEQNLGRVGNYRHTLYHHATGDYVINLDGDDWFVDASYIHKAAGLLESDPGIVCVLGDRTTFFETENRFRERANAHLELPRVMNGNDFFINYPELDFSFSHLSVLYRRKAALALDFYRKNIISSDAESIFRLMLNNKIGYLPDAAGAWRVHSANESGTTEVHRLFENLALFDSLYADAQSRRIFSREVLDDWHLRIRSNHLYRFFITFLQKRAIGAASELLFLAFRDDWQIGYRILKKLLVKIKEKLLAGDAVRTYPKIASARKAEST
jgi:glycosyltransferase involved in cell wall biosynthesis